MGLIFGLYHSFFIVYGEENGCEVVLGTIRSRGEEPLENDGRTYNIKPISIIILATVVTLDAGKLFHKNYNRSEV